MNKPELMIIWKQLDNPCEAIEKLFETEDVRIMLDDSKIDFSAIVSLKNEVEEMIHKKSKIKTVLK